jgi:hypothetical protein
MLDFRPGRMTIVLADQTAFAAGVHRARIASIDWFPLFSSEQAMVLVVIEKIATLTDFIMWASIEFARQYEVFDSQDYNRSPQVIDLSQLSQLGGMKGGELLYMVGHGDSDGTQMYAGDWKKETPVKYEQLGERLGAHISATIVIHCGACFAGKAQPVSSGLKKIATGLQAKGKTGIKVKGFQGATVTNIVGGPTTVVDNSKFNDALSLQSQLTNPGKSSNPFAKFLAPQAKFDAWRTNAPGASVIETAEKSAELNWGFFQKFTFDPTTDRLNGFFCPYPSNPETPTGGEEVFEWS